MVRQVAVAGAVCVELIVAALRIQMRCTAAAQQLGKLLMACAVLSASGVTHPIRAQRRQRIAPPRVLEEVRPTREASHKLTVLAEWTVRVSRVSRVAPIVEYPLTCPRIDVRHSGRGRCALLEVGEAFYGVADGEAAGPDAPNTLGASVS